MKRHVFKVIGRVAFRYVTDVENDSLKRSLNKMDFVFADILCKLFKIA